MSHELPDPLLEALTRLHYTPVAMLTGGASPRRYLQVDHEQGPALAMWTPPSTTPTEHGASVARSLEEMPWLLWRTRLEALGLPVPHLYYAEELADEQGQLFIIEDLGDERFFDRVSTAAPSERLALYEEALALLARWQAAFAPLSLPAPRFDSAHLLAELDEFKRMGLEHRLQITLPESDRTILEELGLTLATKLRPTHLAHRDFQSQNLMFTPRGLVLIDFQDAFYAPATYDLVALLRDSYIRLTQGELDHLLAHYATLTHQELAPLKEAFYLQTIQRKLKDAGRFVTLATRGKTGFLAYFADSIAYVIEALNQLSAFPELRDLLSRYLPEARDAEEALR